MTRARALPLVALLGATLIGASAIRGLPGLTAIAAAMVMLVLAALGSTRPVATAACVAVAVAAGATGLVPSFAGIEITTWAFLVLAVIGLGRRLVDPRNGATMTGTEVAALGLVVVGAVALLTGVVGPAAWPGWFRIVQHVLILIAIASMPATIRSMKVVTGALVAGIAVQVLVALAEIVTGQTFFYSLWKPLEAATWQGIIRVGSTPADPNYLALGLVATLPLVLSLRRLLPGLPRVTVPVLATGWLVAVAFTFSRAGYVGLLAIPVAMALLAHRRSPRTLIVPLLSIAVVTGLFILEPSAPFVSRLASAAGLEADASVTMRLAGQQGAFMAFVSQPLFGLGFDQYVIRGPEFVYAASGIAVNEINALNSFLLVAAEGGILGLAAFIVATGAALRGSMRAASWARGGGHQPDVATYLGAIAVALVVWSLVSLTLDGLHSPVQWILLGMAALAARWHAIDRAEAAQA